MPIPLDAAEVLNREFLEIRAKILEIAAALDRMDRAGGDLADDPRMVRIAQGLAALNRATPDRAEQVQMLFSLEYEAGWREKYGVGGRQV